MLVFVSALVALCLGSFASFHHVYMLLVRDITFISAAASRVWCRAGVDIRMAEVYTVHREYSHDPHGL